MRFVSGAMADRLEQPAEAAVRAWHVHGLAERGCPALLMVLCTTVPPPGPLSTTPRPIQYRSGGRSSPRPGVPAPWSGLNGHALPDRTRNDDRALTAGSGALHRMACQALLIPVTGQRVPAHWRAALRPVAPDRAVSVARALGLRSARTAPWPGRRTRHRTPTRRDLRPHKLT